MSLLYVHAACPWCLSLLHVHAAWPCCMSMPLVHATVCVHTVCPSCVSEKFRRNSFTPCWQYSNSTSNTGLSGLTQQRRFVYQNTFCHFILSFILSIPGPTCHFLASRTSFYWDVPFTIFNPWDWIFILYPFIFIWLCNPFRQSVSKTY
jgi:hypothetical protein